MINLVSFLVPAFILTLSAQQNLMTASDSGHSTIENNHKISAAVSVKAKNGHLYLVQNNLTAELNAPLTVSDQELTVMTAGGEMTLTVLPQTAVDHALGTGLLDELVKHDTEWVPEVSPTPTPLPTATPSATPTPRPSPTPNATISATPRPTLRPRPTLTPTAVPVASTSAAPVIPTTQYSIRLVTDRLNRLVYEIDGVKKKKLFRFKSITVTRTIIISAETNTLITLRQSLMAKLLDLLSI